MLAAPDLALARRDRNLPGLAGVLDADLVAQRLRAALPELEVVTAHPYYVRYKPGTNCLVGYLINTRGGERLGYAKSVGPGGDPKLEKMLALRAVPLTGEAAFTMFPTDRELPALARLSHPDTRRRLLGKLLPDRADLTTGHLRVLRYKPERRCVAVVEGRDGPEVVIRVYDRHDFFDPAHLASGVFSSDGPLRVARRLGRSHRHRVLALEWLPGMPLDTALAGGEVDRAALRRVGEALRLLHHRPVEGLADLAGESE
ncbi:MAG: hypothetical protein ACRDVM_03535, partial [Acidimicrobiia bacterium]